MTVSVPTVDADQTPPAGTALRLGGAGLAALGAWEVFAAVAGPAWVGERLDPAGLIQAATGIQNATLTHGLHALTGVVVFPLAYALVARPLAERVAPWATWWSLGLGYGLLLWVFALYGVAHLVAGFPPFLGFGALAWASLVGHLAYGLVLAALAPRRPGLPQR